MTTTSPLTNPNNDSAGLSEALTRKGFDAKAKSFIKARAKGEAALQRWADKHGISMRSIAACKQHVVYDGEKVPAKVIVSAATGYKTNQFSGGHSRIGSLLAKLGLRLGCMVFVSTAAAIVADAAPVHEGAASTHSITVEKIPSGNTRPNHIFGWHRGVKAQKKIMVTATELSGPGEDACHAIGHEDSEAELVIDSGAFGEVKINFPMKNGQLPHPDLPIGITTVKPITHAKWVKVLNIYARLAITYGSRLTVVAPDKVGFQRETLERIARYKDEIVALMDMGVQVMFVSQKGPEMSQADFDREIEKLIGRSDYIRALPCKKNATSVDEIRAFARDRQPERLHLLGMGLRNTDATKAAQAVAEESGHTKLSMDSCLIKEANGWSNGRDSHPRETLGGPRLFSAMKRKAEELIASGRTWVKDTHELAIRLAWGDDADIAAAMV